MPSNFLAVRYRSGDPAVFTLDGLTTLQQVGSTIVGPGAEDSAGPTAGLNGFNRAINLLGRQFLWHKDVVYQFDGVATWASDHTVADQATAQDSVGHSGMFVWVDYDTGNFGWVGLYRRQSDGNIAALVYTYNTDTYAEFNSGVLHGSSLGSFGQVTQFRDAVYMHGGVATVVSYNPVTNAWATAALGTSGIGGTNTQFLVAENRLFAAYAQSEEAAVWQLVGAGWVQIATLPTVSANQDSFGQALAFYDRASNSAVFVYTQSTSEDSALAYALDLDTLVLTNVSSILPSYLTTPGAVTASPNARQWIFVPIVDVADPAGTANTYVLWGTTNSSAFSLFRHNGLAAPWTFVDVVEATGLYALPRRPTGAGETVYNAGALSVLLTQLTPADNGVDLTLRAAGDPGNADKLVTVRFDDGENGPADQGTLGTPTGGFVGGTSVSANRLINVDADGATSYRVKHEALVDGVGNAARIAYALQIEA